MDVAGTLAAVLPSPERVVSSKDASLYALSIGVSEDPADAADLPFVYELTDAASGFRVFPSIAVLFAQENMKALFSLPTLSFNPALLLHGEQELAFPLDPRTGLARPIPLDTTLSTAARVVAVYDKGSGAVAIIDGVTRARDTATDVAYSRAAVFLRGAGGFGGDRGPKTVVHATLTRRADASRRWTTSASQALLYRLNGDPNPLHADPAIAEAAGFPKPILHGLATLGAAARALVRDLAAGDSTRLLRVRARFSKHVFPGETLVTEMWVLRPGEPGADAARGTAYEASPHRVSTVHFRVVAVERNVEVLSQGEALLALPPAAKL